MDASDGGGLFLVDGVIYPEYPALVMYRDCTVTDREGVGHTAPGGCRGQLEAHRWLCFGRKLFTWRAGVIELM